MLMSDVGGTAAPPTVTLTFADSAARQIPTASISSGSFRPTNAGGGDTCPARRPCRRPPHSQTFNGTNPNGVWSLYVFDDATGDTGSIGGGWCLNIATAAATHHRSPRRPTRRRSARR